MPKTPRRALAAARVLPLGLAASCYMPNVPAPLAAPPKSVDPDCALLAADVRATLETSCSGCHGSTNAKGGISNITDLSRLLAEGEVIARGDPDASKIVSLVESGAMPQGGSPLGAEQVTQLRDYIGRCTADEGAPSPLEAPGCRGERGFISIEEVQEAILNDLVSIKLERRKVTRYMSLVHLANAGYCDPQIEAYRFALTKLANSLSQGPRIVPLQAIDPDRLIYRVDLLELGWTPEIWQKVVDADPYAVEYLGATADAIRAFTGASVFVQQADWFIDAASRPPLYHEVLEIPARLADLEAKLGVDRLGNIAREEEFDTDEVLRSCFNDSGVSENNRCIERHPIPGADNRYYWISYDFADNDPELLHNVFLAPLTFVPNGGEVIFNLPNGLQAYMIVDAAFTRIDDAPIDIVRDHENDGEAVINGISCMGCHNEGMRLHVDEVRAAVIDNFEFDALTRERTRRLYTPEPNFTDAQRDNIERFAEALGLTGSPLLVADMEPTIAVHKAFEQDLDLDRAAAEFGVPRDQVLKKLSALKGLQVLDVSTVDRETFAANFADNACILKIGIARSALCSADEGETGSTGGTTGGESTGGTTGGESTSEDTEALTTQ